MLTKYPLWSQKHHTKRVLEHLNNLDPHIQFTSETSRDDGSINFLDTCVMPHPDKSLITTVYRKPTHTELNLQWDSHHNLVAKYSVINTLTHRAKSVCSCSQLLKEEDYHLRQELTRSKYPGSALNRAIIKSNRSNRRCSNTSNNTADNTHKPHMVVPCIMDLSESCKITCR